MGAKRSRFGSDWARRRAQAVEMGRRIGFFAPIKRCCSAGLCVLRAFTVITCHGRNPTGTAGSGYCRK